MSLQSQLFMEVLHNPVIQGLLVKAAMDALKHAFEKVDESGVAAKNQGWLQPMSVVLATLVTAVNLAMTGNLASLDLNSLKEVALTYLGMKAAGTESVKKAVDVVKANVPTKGA